MVDPVIQALFRRAINAEESGDTVGSLRYSAEVLRLYATDDSARLQVGLCLARLADERGGGEWADMALQALRATVETLRRRGKHLHALAAAAAGLSLAPGDDAIVRVLNQLHKDVYCGDRMTIPPQDKPSRPLIPRSDTMFEHSVLSDDEEALLEHAVELATSGANAPGSGVMGEIPFFSRLPFDKFLSVVAGLRCARHAPNTKLIVQGERDASLFLVVEGKVRVLADAKEGPRTLALLGDGALFGEMAWVTRQPRMATVVTAGPAMTLKLDASIVEASATASAEVDDELYGFAVDRMLENLVEKSPVFAPFSVAERQDILQSFSTVEVAKGERVVEEGRRSGGLYLILRGRVRVMKRITPRQEMIVTDLRDGDVLGEISLVRRSPATASAVAVDDLIVLHIDEAEYHRRVGRRPEIREYLDKLSDERLEIQQSRLTIDSSEAETEQIFLV